MRNNSAVDYLDAHRTLPIGHSPESRAAYLEMSVRQLRMVMGNMMALRRFDAAAIKPYEDDFIMCIGVMEALLGRDAKEPEKPALTAMERLCGMFGRATN